jgi:capsular exopolysaccharide synthesis family protein
VTEQLPRDQPSGASFRNGKGGESTIGPVGPDAAPDLHEWLAVLRRHMRLAGGVAALVVVATAYVTYTTPSLYRATAVVRLVDARRALAGGLVDPGADGDMGLSSANPVLSQVEVLRSRATAGAVVDDLPTLRVAARQFPVSLIKQVRVTPDAVPDSIVLRFGGDDFTALVPGARRDAAYGALVELQAVSFTIAAPPAAENGVLYILSRDAVVDGLTHRLAVKPRENTDVIDITFTATDPRRAQEVANRLAQVFQSGNAHSAQQEAQRRREFIETQLRFNDSLLTDARGALSAFRAKTPNLAAASGSANGLDLRREELEIERRQYAGILGQLRDSNRVARRVALRNVIASSPSIGGNAVVSRLYDQLASYERQLDSLTTGDWARTAANPDVQRVASLVGAAEANLVGAVQSVVASLDARIAVLEDLQARGIATARQLSNTQATEEVLIERVENARRVADQLRIEYQKARIAQAVEAGQVEIVDLAPLPDTPIGVGPVRTMIFGVLLSLLLGGGSAALADHLNRSVHRREDVAQLGLPVLGIVPHAKGGATDDAGPIIDAMRGIRFNVQHAYGAAGPALFTVTSPGTGDGKSFVASNLALAFADAGHRTLLIDGDLRRGSLYRLLHTRRKPGLTDALHGEASLDDAIQATAYPPLFFVGSGTRTPDGPELLGAEAMSRFMAGVRQSFAVIVVDSPPLGAGVDAYALAAMTGHVLMVLRVGTTNREAAEAKLDLLDRLPVRLLGTVLNDVPAHSAYASYSYYMEGYAYEAEHGRTPRTLAGQRPAPRARTRG